MRFLKAGSSVDLVLLAVLDHELAVDDAIEQRREHRLQRHVAILLRQRLLGDLELRQPDRLAVDRGDHRILERLARPARPAAAPRPAGGLAAGWRLAAGGRLGGRRRRGLLGGDRACDRGGCAEQDDRGAGGASDGS